MSSQSHCARRARAISGQITISYELPQRSSRWGGRPTVALCSVNCPTQSHSYFQSTNDAYDFYNVPSSAACSFLCEINKSPVQLDDVARCFGRFQCESWWYVRSTGQCHVTAEKDPQTSRMAFVRVGKSGCNSRTGHLYQLDTVVECMTQILNTTMTLADMTFLSRIQVVEKSKLGDINSMIPSKSMTSVTKYVLPVIKNLDLSIASMSEFHAEAADNLGLSLQVEFQPLIQGGMINGVNFGRAYGYRDWRYCALECALQPLCKAWTFKYPKDRLHNTADDYFKPYNKKLSRRSKLDQLVLYGACYLKTSMISPIIVPESSALAISGSRRFAGWNDESLSPLIQSYFGEYTESLVSQNSTTLESQLEYAGCLRRGQMYFSKEFETGAVPGRYATNATFEHCRDLCANNSECAGFQYIEPSPISKVLLSDHINCRTFTTGTTSPDETWPFVSIVKKSAVCPTLDGTLDPKTRNSMAMREVIWDSPKISHGVLDGVSLRADLIDASLGPKLGPSGDGVNLIGECETVSVCQSLCAETPACEAFSFNSRNHLCALLQKPHDFRRDSTTFMQSGLKNGGAAPVSAVIGAHSNVIPSDQGEERLYVTCSSLSWSAPMNAETEKLAEHTHLYKPQECYELCSSIPNCFQWWYDTNRFLCLYITSPIPPGSSSSSTTSNSIGHYITGLNFCDVGGQPQFGTYSRRFPLTPIVLGAFGGVVALVGAVFAGWFLQRKRRHTESADKGFPDTCE